MNVVLLLVRTRLRSSWRAALVLVVLFGLGGGVTLAVAAGARRTASANDAILRAANASVVSGSFDISSAEHPADMLPRLQALPDVDDISLMVGFIGQLEGDGVPAATLAFLGMLTDTPTVDRPFVTSGRFPTGPNEVLLNEGARANTGLGLGDKATLALFQVAENFTYVGEPVRVGVEVVGIGLLAEEVIEDELGGRRYC